MKSACFRLVLCALSVILFLSAARPALAQANPALDKFAAGKIKEELSKMHDPNTGYRDGPHWLHLENPGQNLSVSVKTVLQEGRASLEGNARGRLAFNYQVEISKTVFGRRIVVARHDFGGYADAVLELQASAKLGAQLTDAKVSIREIRVTNLRMRSDAAKPFQGIIEGWVNGQLNSRKGEIESRLAAAINTIRP